MIAMMMTVMMAMMMAMMIMMLMMMMMVVMMMMMMMAVTGAFLPLSNAGNWLTLAGQRVSQCREGGSPSHGGGAATALEQVLSRNGHPTRVSLPVLVALVVRYFRLAMSCTCRDLASPLLGLVVPVRV